MDASGEVADLMVKESIQVTEESIKLLAAGCKNLTAFLYALAKDNKKLVGKTSMKRLLRDEKELKTFCNKRYQSVILLRVTNRREEDIRLGIFAEVL